MTAALLITLLAASDGGVGGVEQRTRPMMHTLVSVTVPAGLGDKAREEAFSAAFEVFEFIEADLNEWAPGSTLARVNAGAGGPGVEVPARVCEVVELALDGARRTDGLFDPTWASVRDLWRFGTAETGQVPPPARVRKACKSVGWMRVSVERRDGGVGCRVKLAAGQQLGLGGLVKGWGVDQAAAKLSSLGLRDFAVQAGGDLFVAGHRDGRPWSVGLREPRGAPDEAFAQVPVVDRALSTSGDYEHFFMKANVRYHHLLDPRTCEPARASSAVSVLARRATDAEFLTKAAFILGPDGGRALVEGFGADALWVTPDGRVHTTAGFPDGGVRAPAGFTR